MHFLFFFLFRCWILTHYQPVANKQHKTQQIMKKTKLLFIVFGFALLFSCSSNETVSENNNVPAMKKIEYTPEMVQFKEAIIKTVRMKNNTGSKVSSYEQKQEIMINEAKELLKANNISFATYKTDSKEDKAAIIDMAMKLFLEKTKVEYQP